MAVSRSLPEDNDVEPSSLTFAHARRNLFWAVSDDRCLVNAYLNADVVAIYGAVPIPSVKPFNGSKHSSIFVSAQVDKADLHLLALSRALPVLGQGVVMRCVPARAVVGKPAPQGFHFFILKT